MPQKLSSKKEKFLQVVRAFNQNGIRFLIAGARALSFYGYDRFTRDYDICITPDPHEIEKILDILNQLEFRFSEPVDATMISQSINVHLVAEVDIDLLIHPKGFSFEEAWNQRVSVKEEGCELYFVSKEDLITMKEAVGRPQDKLDVQKIKQVVNDEV